MQIASNTNPRNLPLDSDGKRDWSHSLFGCFSDWGTCMFAQSSFLLGCRTLISFTGLTATFCPCILYSQNGSRLNHLAYQGSPHPSGGDAFTGACFGYTVTACVGVSCFLQVRLSVPIGSRCQNLITTQSIQRGNTRARYRISGNGCTDLLAACCCHICDLVQESREIELEENSYGKQSY
jgi:Cys-rich protein (TIGR01571 family)